MAQTHTPWWYSTRVELSEHDLDEVRDWADNGSDSEFAFTHRRANASNDRQNVHHLMETAFWDKLRGWRKADDDRDREDDWYRQLGVVLKSPPFENALDALYALLAEPSLITDPKLKAKLEAVVQLEEDRQYAAEEEED